MNIIDIAKDWGEVAGIGGIALAAFLILMARVLDIDVFSRLTPKQTFLVLVLFLCIVWSTTIFGIWTYQQLATTK